MATETPVQATPTKTVVPGIKTSEFWVTILTTVGAATAGVSGVVSPKIAAFLMAISGLAYTISRGLAKQG